MTLGVLMPIGKTALTTLLCTLSDTSLLTIQLGTLNSVENDSFMTPQK